MKRALKKLASAVFMVFAVTSLTGVLTQAAGKPFTVGGKKYASLQEAFDNVKNGQTIRMNANAAVTEWCSLQKKVNCTLDLNKKTLTVGVNVHINAENGTLTVQNGTAKKLGKSGILFEVFQSAGLHIINGTYIGALDNSGNMAIDNGTFSNIKTNRVPLLNNKGKLTVTGGKFTDNSRSTLLSNRDSGTVILKGGTFNGGSRNKLMESYGKVTISGGTFTGKGEDTEALCNYENGSLTIDGGRFRYAGPFDSEYTDIYAPEWTDGVLICMDSWTKKGKLTINNGTFTSSGTLLRFIGNGKVQINGGTFTAKGGGVLQNANSTKAAIAGGTFTISGAWGLLYNYDEAKLNISKGTFRSAWTVLENYSQKSTITVTGGTFTSTMNRPSSAMVLNFDGTMNIKGGTFTSRGRKTNGFWVGAGKINLTEAKTRITAKALQWKNALDW